MCRYLRGGGQVTPEQPEDDEPPSGEEHQALVEEYERVCGKVMACLTVILCTDSNMLVRLQSGCLLDCHFVH